ncbi:MAG: M16 family metallopeptidase, partial [Clostridiaceae bacterium]
AYTDYKSTVFSITILKEEIEKAVELLGDILRESQFEKNEIKREKGVVLSEIRSSKDDLEDLSFNMVNSIAFNKSGLKHDTLGTEECIEKLNSDVLLDFYKKYYVPNNTIISIVSCYEHEKVVEIIKKYFNNWKVGNNIESKFINEDNKNIEKIMKKNDILDSSLIYLYTFYNLSKEEELALKILNHKLGDSSNSILFRRLREEKGLAYDVSTHMDSTSDIKTIYIYTAVHKDDVEQARNIIENSIFEIKNKEIAFKDENIELMKKVLKTAITLTIEDTVELSNYILEQRIEGESITGFVEDLKSLSTIDKESIYKVANKVLNNPSVHIIIPRD